MSTWSWSRLHEQQGQDQPLGVSYERDGRKFVLRATLQISVPQIPVQVGHWEQHLPWDGGMERDGVSVPGSFRGSSFVTSAPSCRLKSFSVFPGATSAPRAQPTDINWSSHKKSLH